MGSVISFSIRKEGLESLRCMPGLALAILGYVLNQLFNLAHRSLLAWHWGMTTEWE